MAFNVNQFYSNISKRNDLAKRYNFEVQIASAGSWLTMQCEAAEIPGKSFLTAEGKIYGPVYKVPYQTQYEPISLTIVCTNEFDERQFFENWTSKITSDDFNFYYQPTYTSLVYIRQYSDSGTVISTTTLYDAWPSAISPMGLDWSDGSYHKLGVQMTYYSYKMEK